MIKNLVHRCDGDNITALHMHFALICVLGFSRFFRVKELLQLKLKHVQIKESDLEILAPKPETDQIGSAYIFRIESDCCPAKILEKQLNFVDFCIQKDKESFIISCVFKIKSGEKVSKSYEVSCIRVREVCKEYISKLIDNPVCYRLHSL